ncbi:hypothetical protein SynPROS71_02401 [Synechococcus sp. PROS-7-1]|nr:hypothetical protein SynPROS71_02401 [Synechococcus sp. PROS-7-1]
MLSIWLSRPMAALYSAGIERFTGNPPELHPNCTKAVEQRSPEGL